MFVNYHNLHKVILYTYYFYFLVLNKLALGKKSVMLITLVALFDFYIYPIYTVNFKILKNRIN